MRIISGHLRGRDLGRVPDGVRPTTDRVRESLFSSLGAIDGCVVLDLFAGTGALGLEAYSRGAERVVFVERSKRVARALQKRLAQLDLDEAATLRIVVADAKRAMKRLSGETAGGFDLVFVDPPYVEGGESERESALEALFGSGLLAEEGTVVVEGPTRHPLPPLPGIRVVDERRYGDTLLTWLTAEASKP
ncbi:MAG: 16S rRNA (guanine(966)-N(2))-methyltransferase RsmD [Myxococcota bacterium]